MGRCRDLMWLMLAGGLAGCLESNPQPSPFGDDAEGGGVPVFAETTVDEERILASAAGEDGAVVLVGMDGAAAGAEHAEARAGDAEEISFPVDMAGGFGAVVEVPAGAKTLELAFRFPGDDGPTTVTVTLAIPVLAATKDDRTPWFANADAEYDPDAGAGSPPQEVWEGFAGENGLGGVVVTLEGGTARVTGL
ncbi:MAG: hypothetical protein FJ098_07340, partial [Deltaproteobacteria bacterium]|nr:hypothetical protein [Deltaproteobacteria bacterium]